MLMMLLYVLCQCCIQLRELLSSQHWVLEIIKEKFYILLLSESVASSLPFLFPALAAFPLNFGQ
jgi:hypothetical protein